MIENEDVIYSFLEKHSDFSLLEIKHDVHGVWKGRGGLHHT
jgi:16S rRNA C967 or C1407 C5-methylase (RsmB/RsmF family)